MKKKLTKQTKELEEFKLAVAKLFQQFEDDDAAEIEIPEDHFLGPITIIQINFARIYEQQRRKPQKTQLQCLLQQGKQNHIKVALMAQLEKLVREVEALEQCDATLEELYCVPATSELLYEKIEAIEQRELLNERTITLMDIVTGRLRVSPEVFCENFNLEDLQQISKQPHLDQELSAQLKACFAGHKKLLVVNKRHQYITEKLSIEIETILNFTSLTTKEIQEFRTKVEHLRAINTLELNEQRVMEYLAIAEKNKLDLKIQQQLKQQLTALQKPLTTAHSVVVDDAQVFLEDYAVLNRYPIELALNQVTSSKQDSRQFLHQIIRLIRRGSTYGERFQAQLNCLCLLYLQIIWVLKADHVLKHGVTMVRLQTLLSYAAHLKLSGQVEMKQKVLEHLQLYDKLKDQISEYGAQRNLWRQDRQIQVQNLRNVRQQLIYIKNKPSFEHVKSIAMRAQQISLEGLDVILSDLASAETIIAKFGHYQQDVQILKDVKKSMLYSFLKVDHLTTQVYYYLTKHSLLKCIADKSDFQLIQSKMRDLQSIAEVDVFLSGKLNFPLVVAAADNETHQFEENFDWVQSIRDGLEVDFMAVTLKERIQTSFARVIAIEQSEQITLDADRVALREQHCVTFTELDEFMVHSYSRVRFQAPHELDLLLQQHEACKSLKHQFEEMVDRLKEFQLKLELEQLECLIDSYLDGGVCLFVEEMKTLMQYTGMARTFWGEILDQEDIMKHQVFDVKRNKGIHEFLQTFTVTQKKFNVEIPEVKRFADEYYSILGSLEGITKQLEDGAPNYQQIRLTLEKKIPRHFRCLDVYLKCQVDLWTHVASKFLWPEEQAPPNVWTHARLVEEIQEGYKLMDQIISKSLQFGDTQEEMPRSVEQMRQQITHLEELYQQVQSNQFFTKVDLSEKASTELLLKKPFQNPSEYCQAVRQRNLSRLKTQSISKKRDAAQLRIKPKGTVKQLVNVGQLLHARSKKIRKTQLQPTHTHTNLKSQLKKKVLTSQSPEKTKSLKTDVSEQMRGDKKSQLILLMKRNIVFSHQHIEQRVKLLEAQIFGDHHDNKSQYDREFESLHRLFRVLEPLKYISKRIVMKEFDIAEIKRYSAKLHSLKKLNDQLSLKRGAKPKVQQVGSYTLPINNKPPKKQQKQLMDQILKHQRINNLSYPTLVPQTFRKDDDLDTIKKLKTEDSPILYNPETGVESREQLTDICALGMLSIKMSSTLDLRKSSHLKFQMLTSDTAHKIILFPDNLLASLTLNQKACCPASQVVEYINLLKQQETFKYVKGWLHSTNLEEAQELQSMATMMKDQRVAIGTKSFDNQIGISLLHIDQCSKISSLPTKWLLPTHLAQDESYLSKLDDYAKCHLLKPQIAFYLYIKDFKAYSQYFESIQKQKGGLKGTPFSYTSIFKISQLNQIINSQREFQRSTRLQCQTPLPEFHVPNQNYFDVYQNRFEPISDDEDVQISFENKLQALKVLNKPDYGFGFQSLILKEIPNILNLLKNDDDGDQD